MKAPTMRRAPKPAPAPAAEKHFRFLHTPSGALYGITPALWDRPDMTVDDAREVLCRVYGIDERELEALP